MPGPIYHLGNQAMCPHAGQVQDVPSTGRVKVMMQPVAVGTDQFLIVGCAFQGPNGPHPCMTAQWITPAVRVKSMGVPVLLQTSTGLCLAADQAPQGAPAVPVNQPRVIAT